MGDIQGAVTVIGWNHPLVDRADADAGPDPGPPNLDFDRAVQDTVIS